MGAESLACALLLHPKESERIAALESYGILDTPRERDFDEIASLAASICKTPIAVVNFIDRQRQFFKAEVGLGVRETPLETSFCGHALLEEEVLIVPDTREDDRFRNNPLVQGEPHLRFYGGVLLVTADNLPIGTVCVLDYEPRELEETQLAGLKVLATHAMTLLNLRLKIAELDDALTFRKRVLDTVSHDLRNPLGSIAMNATTLVDYPGQSPERVAEIASSIRSASGQMLTLVGDLLDHDALLRNTLRMRIAIHDAAALIREFEKIFLPILEDKNIRWTCELPADPTLISCDPDRFRQILYNLCGNALKFSQPGSEIRLKLTTRDDFAEISVEDTGPGVSSEMAERIFDAFEQGNSHGAGVGLGLSIVRALVGNQGGTVRYDQEYTDGARFLFTLPLAEADGAE